MSNTILESPPRKYTPTSRYAYRYEALRPVALRPCPLLDRCGSCFRPFDRYYALDRHTQSPFAKGVTSPVSRIHRLIRLDPPRPSGSLPIFMAKLQRSDTSYPLPLTGESTPTMFPAWQLALPSARSGIRSPKYTFTLSVHQTGDGARIKRPSLLLVIRYHGRKYLRVTLTAPFHLLELLPFTQRCPACLRREIDRGLAVVLGPGRAVQVMTQSLPTER